MALFSPPPCSDITTEDTDEFTAMVGLREVLEKSWGQVFSDIALC